MRRILIVAFLLFIGAAALLIYAWPTTQEAPPPATVEVQVAGPEGQIWNGTVTANPGTSFGALLAAGDEGNFTVHWTGQGARLYVDEIDGHTDANGGWCVQTDDGSGVWEDRPVSPALQAVADGWSVRWYWTDGQCDRY